MKPRRGFRRRVVTASGRSFTLCGCRRGAGPFFRAAAETAATNLTWITGATLLVVLVFSMYAIQRPPVLPDDPLRSAHVSSFARYTFADVLSAAGTR